MGGVGPPSRDLLWPRPCPRRGGWRDRRGPAGDARCALAEYPSAHCSAAPASCARRRSPLPPPPAAAEGLALPPATLLALRDAAGGRRAELARADGGFAFRAVPPGAHFLEVDALGLTFPSLRVDVAADGAVAARAPDLPGAPPAAYPLRVGPLAQLPYFERRGGFSILGFLKTPYGMMMGFAVFALVVMPMLKVDPEEYAAMKAEASALTGGVIGGGDVVDGGGGSGGGGAVARKRQ